MVSAASPVAVAAASVVPPAADADASVDAASDASAEGEAAVDASADADAAVEAAVDAAVEAAVDAAVEAAPPVEAAVDAVPPVFVPPQAAKMLIIIRPTISARNALNMSIFLLKPYLSLTSSELCDNCNGRELSLVYQYVKSPLSPL